MNVSKISADLSAALSADASADALAIINISSNELLAKFYTRFWLGVRPASTIKIDDF